MVTWRHTSPVYCQSFILITTFYVIYDRWYLQFIRSEFRGQLPKPYSNAPNATKIIPTQMNDMNEEEPSRYVSKGVISELLVTVVSGGSNCMRK